MKGDADSQFKQIGDTEENSDTIHDQRDAKQDI